MSVSEMESYRDLILENIEYDHLCREFTTYREDLDEIVELMVETVCAKRKTTRIAGSDFPHEVVRSRFLKLDCSHIEFVMECLRNNTTEIHFNFIGQFELPQVEEKTPEQIVKEEKALAARNREREQNKLRMRRVRAEQKAAKEAAQREAKGEKTA